MQVAVGWWEEGEQVRIEVLSMADRTEWVQGSTEPGVTEPRNAVEGKCFGMGRLHHGDLAMERRQR
jgi:hypothetical protein